MQFNNRVTKAPTLYDKAQDTHFNLMESYQTQLAEEAIKNEIVEQREKEAEELAQAQNEKMIHAKIAAESRLTIANENANKVARMVARKVVENIFVESLVIDKPAVMSHEDQIRQLVVDYDGEKPIIDRIAEVVKGGTPIVLATIQEGARAVARRYFASVMKEDASDSEVAQGMFEEPKEEDFSSDIEKIEGDIDSQAIADVIKNKVVDVVAEEKEIEKQEEEIQKQIEQDLMDDPDVTDEESLAEAYHKMVIQTTPFRDRSLFRALTENAMREAIKENVYNQQLTSGKVLSQDMDTEQTIQEFNDDQTEEAFKQEAQDEAINQINMEAVMADAIVEYTLLETLHTLQIEKYSHANIKNLVGKLGR